MGNSNFFEQFSPEIREIIKQNFRKISITEMAKLCGCHRTTLGKYIRNLGYDTTHIRAMDMVGQHFNRLTVIEDTGESRVKVKCQCGTEFLTYRQSLRSGKTRSCGCYRAEVNHNRLLKKETKQTVL